MNYTLVILGIVLLLVIYILYKVLDEKSRRVASKMNLINTNQTVAVANTGKAESTRYYISTWIYVNNLPDSVSGTTIYKLKYTSNTYLDLLLTSSAVLKYNIMAADDSNPTYTIMSNFPLQKWMNVIVSVDNNIVDLYIDGKLIRSHKVEKGIKQLEKTGTNIEFGNPVDAYLAKMERQPNAMDPTNAWNKYMEGNGGNYFSKMFANYGGNFTLTKDDLDVQEFQLF
jgi:hypothetical protein